MNDFVTMLYVEWMVLCGRLKEGIQDFFLDEQGDVNVVSIVVLIGIAVVLAILFREQIEGLLNTLFEAIKGNAEEAVAN